jgi:AcrR family transcriptional regulator
MVSPARPPVKSERSFYNGDVPRVSEAHLAARRQQILDAARVRFLQNGFHATSMQDVIGEAGLSVGAVYRYFPSKSHLVTALAEQVTDEVLRMFDDLVAQDPPAPPTQAMSRAVDLVTEMSAPGGPLRLALQVWSEAQRDPLLAEFVAKTYRRLRERIIRIARRAQEYGHLPPTVDPEAVGCVLFALMPGYGLQRMLTGEPEPETFKAGLRALLPG